MNFNHTIKLDDGRQLTHKVKSGKFIFWFLDDGNYITGDYLRKNKIHIQCVECKFYFNIMLYSTLLYRENYICMSCNNHGVKNPFYGKKHSEETKQKLRTNIDGKYNGINNPFYGKKHSEETKQKIVKKLEGRFCGDLNPFYGKKHSIEIIDKIKEKNNIYRNLLTQEEKTNISKKLSETQNLFKLKNPEYYRIIKQKAAYASAASHKKYKMNNIEKIVFDKLKEFDFEFQYTVILNFMQFDFGNKNNKILIEVNGDYWHANPLFYGLKLKPLNDIQKLKQKNDQEKINFANEHNFKLYHIWEYDIKINNWSILENIKNAYKI